MKPPYVIILWKRNLGIICFCKKYRCDINCGVKAHKKETGNNYLFRNSGGGSLFPQDHLTQPFNCMKKP